MIRRLIPLVLALLALAPPARAAVTFEYLFTGGYPLSISDDGTAIAGNTAGAYGPFRWTRSGGFVDLGMAAAPIVGSTGGTPAISADGTVVASTIVGPDSTYSTAGRWTVAGGWQFLLPPIPPGGGVMDRALADVWGMSGDGNTVVGLLWRTNSRAHALKWTPATGPVDLGSSGNASRANGANYTGSVIGGWDESTLYGYRCPAVWTNGQMTVLAPHIIGEVACVSRGGDIVGGFQRDSVTNMRQAALWRRTGMNSWSPVQLLGYVEGSAPGYALNTVKAISADGRMAVGFCSFAGDPFSTTGLIWNEGQGLQDIVVWLANNGIFPDPSFTIYDLTCMTPDGTMIVGYGRDTVSPYTVRAFMIHLDRTPVAVDGPAVAPALQLGATPNPMQSGTTLAFELPADVEASLTVHDAAGRLVRQLASGPLRAGVHQVAWDGRDDAGSRVPAGVYFTRLLAGTRAASHKLVVLR